MTLNELTALLCDAGIENARREALMLAEHFCRVSSARLLADAGEDLSSPELEYAARRRAERYPLQYLIGEWTFLGDDYAVTEDCLIPRPETEELAEMGISALPPGGRMADLCSGSGCVGISVLVRRTDCTCTAVEKYPRTMAVTELNARRHGVADRMEFITADVTEDCLAGEYDVILSNPPYVAAGEMEALDAELAFEPPYALTDGGDGLSVISAVLKLYPKHLSSRGMLALEIGAGQGGEVLALSRRFGCPGEIKKDSFGRDRFFVFRRA